MSGSVSTPRSIRSAPGPASNNIRRSKPRILTALHSREIENRHEMTLANNRRTADWTSPAHQSAESPREGPEWAGSHYVRSDGGAGADGTRRERARNERRHRPR